MKILLKTLLLLAMTINSAAQNSFKQYQLGFDRVKNAYDEKWITLQADLKKAGVKGKFDLYIAAYKTEGKFEVWLKTSAQQPYQLFKTYDFCAHSGTLGPKVFEGDLQTPEGFYHINVFNPESNFHLSLGINYPNKVDAVRTGKNQKPGGDIYIHGACATVGCIPLTDEKIKEVYILAVEAQNAGQKEIPVHIYPFKLTNANLKKYSAIYPQHKSLWETLQLGYTYFEQHKSLPIINQVKGNYIMK